MKPHLAKAVADVPRFQQPTEAADLNQSLAMQRDLIFMMTSLPVRDSIGVACSYLLYAAMNHQTELRRAMNEKVVREGFRGESLLETIQRACR